MPSSDHRSPQLKRALTISLMLAGAFAGPGALLPAMARQQTQQLAAKHAAGISGSANSHLLDNAKKLLQSGDPQGAISLLETADPNAPNAGDIHALNGVCFALLGKPVESATEFDAAIALRPNYAPTYLSAGLASASLNNLDRALDRLADALKLDPNLPGARYNYALVLARAGRFADSELEAQTELDNPHRKAESNLDLWRLKARDFYYQKKWPEALDAYRRTLELDPGWPEAYGAIGEALFSLNRSEESLPMLEKSEALDPDNATTHVLLGKVYQDDEDSQKAIAEFEWAERLRPNDQDVLYHLVRLYGRNGDKAKADRTVKLLEDLAASNYKESISEAKAGPFNSAGLELAKHGDLAGALSQFDKAASEDVTNLIFKRNAALILCKLGRTEEAIRRLRDILNLDPDDTQTLQILKVAKEYELKRSGAAPTLPSLESVH